MQTLQVMTSGPVVALALRKENGVAEFKVATGFDRFCFLTSSISFSIVFRCADICLMRDSS